MKYILSIIFVFGTLSSVSSQTLLSHIQSEIESHLSSNLETRYKGGVNITKADEKGSDLIISGNFQYQIQTWIGPGNTVTRDFKAKARAILDEIRIIKLCYVYIVYDPGGETKKCKCTDGTYEGRSGELFVK